MATGLIATWMRFRVQEVTLSILTGALEIKAAHGSACSDSAIIPAARALGCRELYTEDMTHGREVEGGHHHKSVSLIRAPLMLPSLRAKLRLSRCAEKMCRR
jgi:hypothetical protein